VREEVGMRFLENRVLMEILEPKRVEVTEVEENT
jgi:hypothetical protein